jgi:hypothetical protein
LATLGKSIPFLEGGTLKELRRRLLIPPPFSGLRTISARILNLGFQSKHFHPTRAARVGTPAWADFANDFSVIQFLLKSLIQMQFVS